MTHLQKSVLKSISAEPLKPGQIAKEVGEPTGTVTICLTNLKRQGLVEKDVSGRYGITEEGRNA